jgi:hypothetical protein
VSVPFLALFIAIAAEETVPEARDWLGFAAEQIGLGTLIGLLAGGLGGWVVQRAAERERAVEQGYLTALASDRVSHEQTVERIRSLHKLGLVVAERLAHSEPVYRQLPRGAVRRALESLRDAAIIESRGRGAWRFTNPLFRRYLATIGPFD